MADVSFTFSGDAFSLRQALDDIRGEAAKTRSAVESLAGKFVVAFAVAKSAIESVKAAFSSLAGISKAAAEFEQTSLAFRVMLKDAQLASQYVSHLRSYAAQTPFSFEDISNAAKTLLAMGTEAEKSIAVIKKLGDIASVSGKPLKDLASLYAKVQNMGLSNEVAESLEMQGVPIRKLIAEMKGVSFEQVFQGISKRQFNVSDLDAALDRLTGSGGLLENMTKLQSQTFSGALSTLKDNFSALAVELGQPINAAIIPVMQQITEFVASCTPQIKAFGEGVSNAFSGMVEVIAPIISGFGELLSLLGGAKTAIAATAAALLLYAGNSKVAAVQTVSLRTQVGGLVSTLRGLSLASVANGFMASLASMRSMLVSSLAGMKVAWSVAWSTMAAVARAAMIAVKAAIVSTGIGLIIVGIGEALGAFYSWLMNNEEAAKQAAASAREFANSLKRIEKSAVKVKTQDQYAAFMDELQERIDTLREQRRQSYDNEEWDKGDQLTRQLAKLWEMQAAYKQSLPIQIAKAQAAEREADAIRRQHEEAVELTKKIAETEANIGKAYREQQAKLREDYLSSLDTETQIQLRLGDAGGFKSLEELQAAMDELVHRPKTQLGDDERYKQLASAYNTILKLRKEAAKETDGETENERKRCEEAEKARAQAEQDYSQKLALLEAERVQDEKRLELLKREQRIVQLTAEYRRQGMENAAALAQRMVDAELAADMAREQKEQRERNNRQGNSRMSGT